MQAPPVGFLDLPREIRDDIYSLLLTDVQISKPALGGDVHLQILRANRQIGHEAREIFCKTNRFVRLSLDLRKRNTDVFESMIDSLYSNVPLIRKDGGLLNAFKGFIMTYEISEPQYEILEAHYGTSEANEIPKPILHQEFVMLHQDFRLLCLYLQTFMCTATFANKTNHSITLHNPVKDIDTSFPTVHQQEEFLAPFSELRGFKKIFLQGTIDSTVAVQTIGKVCKKPEEIKRDRILQELRIQDRLGDEYLQQDDLDKSSKIWTDACNRIDLLGRRVFKSSKRFGYPPASKLWVDQIQELFFELNRKLAINTIRTIEANDDPALVSRISHLTVHRINRVMNVRASRKANWKPSTVQKADMLRQMAVIHRLNGHLWAPLGSFGRHQRRL
ncbi:uncharacterized protein PG998_009567 [Apiospora kogelbergensis]|uniref:uncharacterized protein n=1 Tax=Apiospora kogelbergensis TaxID=1337665 RepID=UPI0031322321